VIGDVADHLVGHFVDQARRSGASWTAIGASMGVTKQAAQQRSVPKLPSVTLDPEDGFGRFTPRARNVIVAAHDEARWARSDHVTPAHLVLGLLAEPNAIAARVIDGAGVTAAAVRAAATALVPPASANPPELVPYDGEAKKVLQLTFREALRLGHNYIGTEHILLGLLELEAGDGLLAGLGLEKAAIEEAILEALQD
jgi:ATP-dependent Clp protease ATP-binding subunit ClpA